jgi:hypothetical protein
MRPHYSIQFGVPFHSAMSDADIARLAAELNLTTCFHPKLHPAVAPLGFVRLDLYSGLFLRRGKRDRESVLECRTGDGPARDALHEWRRARTSRWRPDWNQASWSCDDGEPEYEVL